MNTLSNLQRSYDNILPHDNDNNDKLIKYIHNEFKCLNSKIILLIKERINQLYSSNVISNKAKLELIDKFNDVCFDIDSATDEFLINIQDITANAATNNPPDIDYED